MFRSLKVSLAFVVLIVVFGICTGDGNSIEDGSSQCMPLADCEFFDWYIDDGKYGKRGFGKEKVDAVLRRHECTVDENGVVQETGRYKTAS